MLNVNDKIRVLSSLAVGTQVRLTTDPRIFTFVRMKNVKFIATSDGQSYDIPATLFKEVVTDESGQTEVAVEATYDIDSIMPGELFYIFNSRKQIVVYQFKQRNSKTHLLATHPVTKQGIKIPISMVQGLVSDLSK